MKRCSCSRNRSLLWRDLTIWCLIACHSVIRAFVAYKRKFHTMYFQNRSWTARARMYFEHISRQRWGKLLVVFCGSESLTTLENKILESMVPSFHIYFWSPEPGLLRTQSPTSMRPKWLWERENPYHCPRSHAAQLTGDRVAVSSILRGKVEVCFTVYWELIHLWNGKTCGRRYSWAWN